ncbi:zinc finger CCCH domain-containing 19 [Chlorella sorokiniana]|uniref:Zinc finger CCCH domain-containing 19 n=1 Tax=Chlorella sorokiniana TaxID=3076 RepID=A0A2P6TY70_CHLSO|nr:zinc finger CCCH domain-containing 19 [Chlorella sorokiniana]|eukprot:PRW59014.1 zinc finger CCCH domain-containing 19 [Chlorella sorokiniana]
MPRWLQWLQWPASKQRPLHSAAPAVPPSCAGGSSGSGDTGKLSPAPGPASKRRQDALESQVQHQIRMTKYKQFDEECRQLTLQVEEELRRRKEHRRQADAKRQRAEARRWGGTSAAPAGSINSTDQLGIIPG